MKWPNHGGQPETIKQLLDIQTDREFLDFSANLNPFGPPSWLKDAIHSHYDTITRYPEPTYSKCSQAVADFEGIGADQILLTNGGAEAIFLVAKYFENKKAIIVHPTFSEYERACRHYHLEVSEMFYDARNDFQLPVPLFKEKLKEADIVFLCRPNNPTGTVIPEEELQLLVEEGQKMGTYVIIDEAFVDFLPESIPSLTSWVSMYPNVILLRSLTKMYTIPGLRFGYVMAHPAVISTLKDEQIPWSINSLVDAVVPKLLEDQNFVEHTKTVLHKQSEYISRVLASLDFIMSPTKVNFYLLRDKKHPERMEELYYFILKHGIVTRHTHNFKGLNGDYLRVAIRSKEENELLLSVLRQWRNES